MFKDRIDAAKQLAAKLGKYKGRGNAVVLAIPRGGLQIGRVLADELHCPLDSIFSKKIPLPVAEEVAIGAVSQGGAFVVDNVAVAAYGVNADYIEKKKRELTTHIKELDEKYHKNAKRIQLKSKIVILTDDGIATGETVKAAILFLRGQKVKKIVLAVPVASPERWKEISKLVDEAVAVLLPPWLEAIGQFYYNFPQLSHEAAIKLL